ncbi:MAG: hypothetical protein IJT12_09205 [Paludibacteraceae bacterium]|nr:hypothetical protein [Paludibacteraceae bacterium]
MNGTDLTNLTNADPTDADLQTLFERYSKSLRKAVDTVYRRDSGDGMSDRLRANLTRFAAYKAAYVERKLQEVRDDPKYEDKAAVSRGLLRAYAMRGDAEYSTAVARCRTAKQFAMFMQPERVEQYPNLRWLRSTSVNPRAEHAKFYDRVWAKDDPFWNTNSPGTEWNCKCDIEETDEPVWDNSGLKLPEPVPGLEGNPAKTGEVFTDKVGYIKDAGGSNTQKRKAECECQSLERSHLQKEAKVHNALKQTFTCVVGGMENNIHVADWGVKEIAQSMFGTSQFWLKNEILNHLSLFDGAVQVGDGIVDLTHNTGKTLRLKRKFKHFFYVQKKLPDGEDVILNIALHEDGNYYLYTITKRCPTY